MLCGCNHGQPPPATLLTRRSLVGMAARTCAFLLTALTARTGKLVFLLTALTARTATKATARTRKLATASGSEKRDIRESPQLEKMLLDIQSLVASDPKWFAQKALSFRAGVVCA